MEEWSIRCEVFSGVDTPLEAGTRSEFADLEGIFKTYRIVFIEY